MTNVFFGLSGGLGPVFRTLPIADQLKKMGFNVYFSIYGEQSAKMIERMGYKHLEDDDPVVPDQRKMVPPSEHFYNLDHYFAQAGLLDEKFVESWVNHRIQMIKKINADLVIADMSPHTIIAAKYLKIPSVSITQSCFHPKGDPLYICNEIPRNIPKVTPIMNKILNRLGLPNINKVEDLNQGDIDIVPGIPEMDPIASEKVHYVGPIHHEYLSEDHLDIKNKKPYILVYPGRLYDVSGNSGVRLLNVLKEGFNGKDQHVVVATKEPIPDDWKNNLTNNFHIIPHFTEEILEQSQLFIHHGGHGSCLSALVRGVPSLIIPTHTERLFNARKICELGLGEYMLPNTIIGEYLYQLANFIINDQYSTNIRILNEGIEKRNYRGTVQVIEILKSEGIV
jgi:uncharacterized protein (TIGR00661 family)